MAATRLGLAAPVVVEDRPGEEGVAAVWVLVLVESVWVWVWVLVATL